MIHKKGPQKAQLLSVPERLGGGCKAGGGVERVGEMNCEDNVLTVKLLRSRRREVARKSGSQTLDVGIRRP